MIPESLTSPLEKISALTTETELYIFQGSAIAVAGLWRRQCDLSLWEIQRRKLIEVSLPNHKDLETYPFTLMNVQFRITFCLQRTLKVLIFAIFLYCQQKYYIFEKKKNIIPRAKTEKALKYLGINQLIVTNKLKRMKETI